MENFLFLSTKADGRNKEARTHIAYRHHRQRKLRQPQLLEIKRKQEKTKKIKEITVPTPESNDGKDTKTPSAVLRSRAQDLPHRSDPLSVLQRGCSDPFGASVVKIDPAVNRLLQYSQKWYADSKWSLGHALSKDSHPAEAWTLDMKDAICNKGNFYAALAVACHYAASLQESTAPEIALRRGLHYKILGIKAVREEIANQPQTADTITTILDLGAAGFFAGNLEETLLHLQAAKAIIDDFGGLANVKPRIRDFAGLSDCVYSWNFVRRPVFAVDDWDPGPWHLQQLDKRPEALLKLEPSTFVASASFEESELPSAFLRAALFQLREVLQVRQSISSIADIGDQNATLRWMHIRSNALHMRLLNHYLDNVGDSRADWIASRRLHGDLSAAVCIAARFLHSFSMYNTAIIVKHFPAQLMYTTFKIDMQGLDTEVPHRQHLFLWLYFVGAVYEELAEVSLAYEPDISFLKKFQTMINVMQLRSSDEIRYILRCFLYGEILETRLQRYI